MAHQQVELPFYALVSPLPSDALVCCVFFSQEVLGRFLLCLAAETGIKDCCANMVRLNVQSVPAESVLSSTKQ
jgi:hypothetical protein